MLFDLLLGDEADATCPVFRGVVEDVVNGEAMGVFGSEVVEFFSEKNIFQVYVSVDKGEFCLVGRVLESGSDDLEHGCYAGTTSNHANMTRQGGGILEEALGTTNLDLVAYFEEGDIARDVSFFVGLGRRSRVCGGISEEEIP